MGKKLFVGNLSFNTTNADLEALFTAIGPCDSATVVTDRATSRSRGTTRFVPPVASRPTRRSQAG